MGLHAYFLNRGRVDSILLECDGEYAFVDGGYRKDGEKAVSFMKTIGVTELTYYIASHGHKNHIEAAGVIMDEFPTKLLVVGRMAVKESIFRYAKTGGETEGVNAALCRIAYPGYAFQLGSATLRCIAPDRQRDIRCGAYSENANSLIIRVEHNGRNKLLLTGDSSASIIAKLGSSARADVLKNPHHAGSQPSSLLNQVNPCEVIVCSNVKPMPAYRKRIANSGAILRSTCEGRIELKL